MRCSQLVISISMLKYRKRQSILPANFTEKHTLSEKAPLCYMKCSRHVAIKQLEPFENVSIGAQSKAVKRRIQQELEILASLRHWNLMSLRAYIREFDRYSLIYDYAPTGSLEDALRRVRKNQLKLNWELLH
ncbi:unnamed protein product [Fraxinus pennsylvanica]|uniref:Protein kinase domain-containing protein n=1 Tax=Fraxinus pennsylvanica TaxID=56036 RepID=A0AAD1Z878_9LAMI|nr:unnamed protein product [Fraxinus pennsylvanica]